MGKLDDPRSEVNRKHPLSSVLRGTHELKNGLGPLHSVSVWAADYGITRAQVATTEKSNEITAIPQVLDMVDLKGAIITIDDATC